MKKVYRTLRKSLRINRSKSSPNNPPIQVESATEGSMPAIIPSNHASNSLNKKNPEFGHMNFLKKAPTAVVTKPEDLKFVIFDFGSVLRVRTKERENVIQSLCEKMNRKLDEIDPENKLKRPTEEKSFGKLVKGSKWKENVGYGKLSRDDAYRLAFIEMGIDPAASPENTKFMKEIVDVYDFEQKEVLKEMRNLLRKLKGREDVVMGVISNHCSSLRGWFKERFDLIPEIFPDELVVISAEEGCKKPDAKIYEVMLNRLETYENGKLKFKHETHAHKMIFIDNKPENCDVARNLGMKSICYKHDFNQAAATVAKLEEQIFSFLAGGDVVDVQGPKSGNDMLDD